MALLVTVMAATGQNHVTTLTRDFMPPTPQSAKIQEVQLPQPSLLTGTAEFAIPIYTVQAGDYSLPITLQYHSSGIKVEEDPAPVGYGWTLQPALRATRTVLGRPDELHPFREDLGNDVIRLYECMLVPTAPLPYGMEHADSQHDIFTFSLPGKTITRILDCRTGSPVFVGGIDDEYVVESNKNLNPIDVYGPDGTCYRFGGPTEYQPVDYAGPGTIRTAWALNEITTPAGEKITINWNFRTHTNTAQIIEGITFYDSRNPIHWFGSTLLPEDLTYDSYDDAVFTTYGGCPYVIEPISISYPGGNVKFNYSTENRTTYLTSVTAADAAETTVLEANLSYGDGKLQSVTLSNQGVYAMDYIGGMCTTRHQHAQDWWGYYNDRNNATLTPFVILKHHWEESNAGMYRQYGQADRSVDTVAMKTGMLRQVTFPTGGKVSFEYEAHRFKPMRLEAGTDEISPETNPYLSCGGGLRVSAVELDEGDGTPLRVTYRYDSIHVRAVPSMATFIDIVHAMLPLDSQLGATVRISKTRCVHISGRSNYMHNDLGTLPIWYGKVTATYPEGKIEYTFDETVPDNKIHIDFGQRVNHAIFKAFSPGPQLTAKTTYQGTDGRYTPVETETWTYEPVMGEALGSTNIQRLIIQASQSNYAPDFDDGFYMNGTYGSGRAVVTEQIYQPWEYSTIAYTERLTSKSHTLHTPTGDITSSEYYSYEPRTTLIRSVSRSSSDGNPTITSVRYAMDGTDSTSIDMTADHRGGIALSEITVHGSATTRHRAYYRKHRSGLFLPERTSVSYGNGAELFSPVMYYDNMGHPWLSEDEDSIAIKWRWSDDGRNLLSFVQGPTYVNLKLHSITIGGGVTVDTDELETRFTYTPSGRLSSITSPAGLKQTFTYDSADRLTGSYAGQNKISAFRYRINHDRNNYVISETYFDESRADCVTTRYDGLGRHTGSSELSTGLRTFTRYDAMGRACAVSVPSVDAPGDYDWTLTFFEASPRAQTTSRLLPGEEWYRGNKKATTRILANTASGDYSCPSLGFNSSITHRGNYPAGRLAVTETVDEDGHTVRTFTDLDGKEVMRLEGRNGQMLSTRKVYDDYGRLRSVLPPGLTSTSLMPYDPEYQEKAFEYNYDSFGRLSSARTPGCTSTQYKYSDAGRVVARHTPAMETGVWEIFLYDKFGRNVFNLYAKASSQQLDSLCRHFKPVQYTGTGPYAGYEGNLPYLPSDFTPIKAGYFDNYDFVNVYAPELAQSKFTDNIKGMAAGSVDFLAGNIISIYGYDSLGRLSTTATQWLSGIQNCTRTFDLQGNLLKEYETYQTSTGRTITRNTANTFDVSGRLTSTQIIENGHTASVTYRYNPDGRLASVVYPGGVAADYSYNIHGWLTAHTVKGEMRKNDDTGLKSSLSSQYYPELAAGGTPGPITPPVLATATLLDERVYYQDGETPLFGGCASAHSVFPSGRYNYTFDNYNRLTAADYIPPSNESSEADFSVSYTYDAIGNPLSLTRYGITGISGDGSETFGILDRLDYDYSGNARVASISQRGEGEEFYGRTGYPLTDGEYSWNRAGMLTSDSSRGIRHISYNRLGLTDSVVMDDGTLCRYHYAADSTLLAIHTTRPSGKYSIGTMRNYEAGRVFENLGLVYSAFAGGYFDGSGAPHYYHTDYRGNIVMVTDSAGRVEQRTSYYPYGEPHRAPSGQPFLFAAKERQNLGGDYLFGPRNLISSALIWDRPDLMAGQYPSVSPWTYCASNPIRYTDPTGNDIFKLDLYGNLIDNISDTDEDKFIIYGDEDTRESQSYEYGTIQFREDLGDSDIYDVYEIAGDNNARSIFEFLADNTNVEYSLYNTSLDGHSMNYITTSHSINSERGCSQLLRRHYSQIGAIRSHTHNHPSGLLAISVGDYDFAHRLIVNLKNYDVLMYLYISPSKSHKRRYAVYGLFSTVAEPL